MAGFTLAVSLRRNVLPTAPSNLRRHMAGVTSQSAGEIQTRARANIRAQGAVDTGALYRGVEVVPLADTSYQVVSTRDVPGDDPRVPSYVELGTSRMAARPYFWPAVEQVRPRFDAETRAIAGAILGNVRSGRSARRGAAR